MPFKLGSSLVTFVTTSFHCSKHSSESANCKVGFVISKNRIEQYVYYLPEHQELCSKYLIRKAIS